MGPGGCQETAEITERYRRLWPPASYLGGLPAAVRRDLLGCGSLVTFMRGETIIAEGEEGDEVFLLISSCVKVTARSADGTDALLAIRVAGDLVGELAVLDGAPRSATVTACSPERLVAVVVHHAELAAFLDGHPVAARALSRMLSHRLRWANRRRLEFNGCNVAARTARVLVELVETYGRPLPRRGTALGTTLNQTELATLVGAAVPSVQKVMRELRAADLVETGYRTIVVLDLPGLRVAGGLPANGNPFF